jgi:hypothetical protein
VPAGGSREAGRQGGARRDRSAWWTGRLDARRGCSAWWVGCLERRGLHWACRGARRRLQEAGRQGGARRDRSAWWTGCRGAGLGLRWACRGLREACLDGTPDRWTVCQDVWPDHRREDQNRRGAGHRVGRGAWPGRPRACRERGRCVRRRLRWGHPVRTHQDLGRRDRGGWAFRDLDHLAADRRSPGARCGESIRRDWVPGRGQVRVGRVLLGPRCRRAVPARRADGFGHRPAALRRVGRRRARGQGRLRPGRSRVHVPDPLPSAHSRAGHRQVDDSCLPQADHQRPHGLGHQPQANHHQQQRAGHRGARVPDHQPQAARRRPHDPDHQPQAAHRGAHEPDHQPQANHQRPNDPDHQPQANHLRVRELRVNRRKVSCQSPDRREAGLPGSVCRRPQVAWHLQRTGSVPVHPSARLTS